MTITATELKNDLSKYLSIAEQEEVFVSKNGKIIAKISSPYEDKLAKAESLIGIFSSDATDEEIREERLKSRGLLGWYLCYFRCFIDT